jgi:hypothetical protein
VGAVYPEVSIVGGSAAMLWCCKACGQDWPITRGEQETEERRIGATDRRRKSRKDRRRKP